jgi:recombination protein RecA
MKATKKATKKATVKATVAASPPRKKEGHPEKRATQLQVLLQARDHMREKFKPGKDGESKGNIFIMDELDNTVPGYISTGSLAIDWITGGRGVPQSRIVDASGDQGVGKSTFGDHLMAEVQRIGGHSWLWDTENARDDAYQQRLGVSRKKAGQIDCHTMEDGFEFMMELVTWHNANDPGRPGIIVWDTPAGTPTRAEVDPEQKAERFGPAKLIRGWVRKLNQQLQQGHWILVVINQTYMGTLPSGQTYKAVYGGGGIPFYSSVRLTFSHPSKVWRSTVEKEAGVPPVGQTVWIKCDKNRVGSPHRSRQAFIRYGAGYDNVWDVFNVLSGCGCLSHPPKSSWYSFDADGWPELATKYPEVKFQGQHFGLIEVLHKTGEDGKLLYPDLFADMLRAYQQIDATAQPTLEGTGGKADVE